MKLIDEVKAINKVILVLGIVGLLAIILNMLTFNNEGVVDFLLGMALTLNIISISIFFIQSHNIKVLLKEIEKECIDICSKL